MADLIPAEELRVALWPPRPLGGQQVGSGPTGVEIEHLPTGTMARACAHRSQHINRMIAMDMILAAITHPRFER